MGIACAGGSGSGGREKEGEFHGKRGAACRIDRKKKFGRQEEWNKDEMGEQSSRASTNG